MLIIIGCVCQKGKITSIEKKKWMLTRFTSQTVQPSDILDLDG